MVNLQELKKICQPEEITSRVVERWYGRFYRKIDLRVTWLLLHFKKITPNMVTAFNLLWCSLGGFLILLPGIWGPLLFFLVFQLWVILDGVDGEIARYKKMKTLSGPYLDLLAHRLVYVGLFVPLGIKIYFLTGQLFFIGLGLATAILALLVEAARYCEVVVLYKRNIRSAEAGESKKEGGIFLAFYRGLIGPMEISTLAVVAILTRPFFVHQFKYFWEIFFGFYLLLFVVSFVYHTLTVKHRLDASRPGMSR